MRASGAFIKMDYPGHGVLETVNSPVFIDGFEKRKPTAAPEVGQHTREVLRDLGYSDDQVEAMIRGASIAAK
jgi:formyl-CoA transferase